MKTTYENISNFLVIADRWLSKNENNAFTKLGYALSKVIPKAELLIKDYREKVSELEIDACEADEKGRILKENDTLIFSKEGLKSLNKKRQNLFKSEVEIKPYIAASIPVDLTPLESYFLEGFVIEASQETEE